MNVIEAIHARRAVRAYQPRAVDEQTVALLLETAVQAPSAMNAQPWGFVVIQDRERLRGYSERAKALLLQGTPADEKTGRYATRLGDPAFNVFYDAGTLIVICAAVSGRYTDADCWLAAQTLMLAACERGLGTCPIGFAIPLLNQTDVKRELGIPERGAAVAPIIVGYPAGSVAPIQRTAPRILSWEARSKAPTAKRPE